MISGTKSAEGNPRGGSTPCRHHLKYQYPLWIQNLAALLRAKMSGGRFRIQPGIVLRECEAWTVVDRNSRNARVFGARYWREG
jgi:hypothetical protein